MEFSTVILVRGINVGGKNRLPMAELRSAIETTGGGRCQTYIQSGNAVSAHPVDSDELGAEIDRRVGFRPAIVTMTAADLSDAVTASPFNLDDGDGRNVHVYFGDRPITFDIESARELATSSERIEHVGRRVYLSAPDGVGRSKLAASVERFSSSPLTARNGRTVLRILDMLGVADVG